MISAAINRLPNEVVMLAAQGIVVSLSVMIESPIINMLATATALVRDRASYVVVRNFTVGWAVVLTAVTVLVAFTSFFEVVVVGWLEAPPEVAQWVRPGMQIMTLWSAAIAWRRFLQGVLIHFGQTRRVAWGTAVRLAVSGGAVWGLAHGAKSWTGVEIGVTALMAGVIAEALFATWMVRPLFRAELSGDVVAEGEALSYGELFWFHLPLASTAVLTLFAQPLVASSLARLDEPTLSLAAWPVLFQLMLLARAAALALPEVVIALNKGAQSFMPLRRFMVLLGGVLTVLMVLFVFTPTADFYFLGVQDMEAHVSVLAQSTLTLFLLFPAMAAVTSWLRGLLIVRRATQAVNVGMMVNLGVTVAILGVGLWQRWAGLPTAAVALNVAALVEAVYLGWRTQLILPEGMVLMGGGAANGRRAMLL